tara:strand:- start:52309 stop:52599 length:291 start_codon:yes stop_codon:yes gene_type:complete
MKYEVVNLLDACVSRTVEANSIEEAIDSIEYDTNLCHHCAGRVDLEDVGAFIVFDEDGNELYNDTYTGMLNEKLEEANKEISSLKKFIKDLEDKYF